MVSIKDIAERCQVSSATVSKAMNGHRDVSETTRMLVMQVAAEMGYLPNLAARALKTNRTYNLGVLFVDDTLSGLSHEYFAPVLESFKAEAEAEGYSITFISRNVGKQRTTYLENCRYRSVDGVLIASVNFEDPDVIELVNSEVPVIVIDYVFNNRSAIISDNISGMSDLVNYVCDRGHSRLAFIHGEETSVTKARLASFYHTCEQRGVHVPEEYVRKGAYHDTECTAQLTQELLALKTRPTCIFFPDDFSALGGMNAIGNAGLSIPQDISVVGYDGIRLSRVLQPPLTTLHQDTKTIGKCAAERLISYIERPKTTLPSNIVVPGILQEGASVLNLLTAND